MKARHRAADRRSIHEPHVRRVSNPDHIPRHLAHDHGDEADVLIVLIEPQQNANVIPETSE